MPQTSACVSHSNIAANTSLTFQCRFHWLIGLNELPLARSLGQLRPTTSTQTDVSCAEFSTADWKLYKMRCSLMLNYRNALDYTSIQIFTPCFLWSTMQNADAD